MGALVPYQMHPHTHPNQRDTGGAREDCQWVVAAQLSRLSEDYDEESIVLWSCAAA